MPREVRPEEPDAGPYQIPEQWRERRTPKLATSLWVLQFPERGWNPGATDKATGGKGGNQSTQTEGGSKNEDDEDISKSKGGGEDDKDSDQKAEGGGEVNYQKTLRSGGGVMPNGHGYTSGCQQEPVSIFKGIRPSLMGSSWRVVTRRVGNRAPRPHDALQSGFAHFAAGGQRCHRPIRIPPHQGLPHLGHGSRTRIDHW